MSTWLEQIFTGAFIIIGVVLGFFLNVIGYGFFWGLVFGVIGIVFGVLNGTFPLYVSVTFADGVLLGVGWGVADTIINTLKLLGKS